jgi:hypothetical protein
MEMLTKEKSSQKRKSVNIQNNSVSYFRICNTGLHHHHHDNNQLRNNKKWSYEWVVLPKARESLGESRDKNENLRFSV